jgi:hypothetical protein
MSSPSSRRAGRRAVGTLVGLLAAAVLGACGAGPSPTTGGTAGTPPPTAVGSPAPTPATTTHNAAPLTSVVATTLAVRLPAPASRVAAVATSDHLLLLGGLVAGGTSTQVLALDPATGAVSAAGRLPHATHDAGAAVLGGSALVLGGGVQASADWVQAIPVAGGTGAVVGHLPQPRSDHVVVSDGTTAYVVGGYGTGPELTDVLATTDGITFHVVAHLVTGVRYAAAALAGGALWVIGGEHGGAQVDTIQRVDLATGAGAVVGHLPAPLSHATATVLGGSVLVVGGLRAGARVDAIERVDPTGAPALVGHLPAAASDAAIAVLRDSAYVVGGETGPAGGTVHSIDTVVRLTTGPASPAP